MKIIENNEYFHIVNRFNEKLCDDLPKDKYTYNVCNGFIFVEKDNEDISLYSTDGKCLPNTRITKKDNTYFLHYYDNKYTLKVRKHYRNYYVTISGDKIYCIIDPYLKNIHNLYQSDNNEKHKISKYKLYYLSKYFTDETHIYNTRSDFKIEKPDDYSSVINDYFYLSKKTINNKVCFFIKSFNKIVEHMVSIDTIFVNSRFYDRENNIYNIIDDKIEIRNMTSKKISIIDNYNNIITFDENNQYIMIHNKNKIYNININIIVNDDYHIKKGAIIKLNKI